MKNPIDAVAHIKHAAVLKANLQRLKQTLAVLKANLQRLKQTLASDEELAGYADMFLWKNSEKLFGNYGTSDGTK